MIFHEEWSGSLMLKDTPGSNRNVPVQSKAAKPRACKSGVTEESLLTDAPHNNLNVAQQAFQ